MHTQITSYCAVCKKKHTANSFAHTYLRCTIYHPCSYTTLEDLLHRKTDESAVFANSELSLKHVDVYGFDFDYTLVHYTTEVNKLIYELARDRLVKKLNVCLQLSLFIFVCIVLNEKISASISSCYDFIASLLGHTLTVLCIDPSHNCSG